MRVILVRHGETKWVREGKYQGSTDISLNQQGFRQAKAVAKWLKLERPDVVIASGLKRAQETAKYIAKACRKELLIDKRLNEVSFGSWEGRSHEAVRLEEPKATDFWYSARWASKPPGGESLKSLERRIANFWKALTRKYLKENATCVIVTHGCPIRMFLIHILKVKPNVFWTFHIDPASLTVLDVGSKKARVSLVNSQFHLNGLKSD